MDGMVDVSSLSQNVGRIRRERQLSLGSLAERAGLAKQTLANLESGRGNPTVQTLLAVATALGVSANVLLSEWGSPVLVGAADEATWAEDRGAKRRTLDQIYGTGQVTTAIVRLGNHRVVREGLPSGSMHHVYVITGTVDAGPVEDLRQLGPGDFIRFAGDTPHVLRATPTTATVHIVTTIPKVQQFSPS